MRLALFFLLCFSAIFASAQQKTRLIDDWQFLRQDLGGIWEAVRPVTAGNPESVPLWQNVRLPHCVNARDAVDPDVNYYQGPSWYRTQLDIKNPYNNGRTLLNFEGAGQKTDVYVYTTKVGSHVGGYDEFTIDITDAVDSFKKTDIFQKQFKGKVPVSIRTDNSRDLELVPSDLSDFNLYGGIYRYLNLVYVPEVSLSKLLITPTLTNNRKTGQLKVITGLRDYTKAAVNISIKLFDPKGKLVSQTESDSLKISNPQLWSTEKPNLYTVEVTVVRGKSSYTEKQKIGFRDFEFIKKGPFHLNGSRLLLRGTHRHEDHAGVAAAMTEDMMRQEMIMMKEMGVNFIRLGHYQQSRIILDLCDSLGILVWEEIPWCRGGLGGDVYKQRAKQMLVNMIEQHYNHPSIIIWGLGNENDWPGDFPEFDKEKIRAFMKELNDLSHEMDATRKTAIRRCDFCKDIVDVYSPSIWAGWYRGIYTEYKSVSEAEMQKVDHFLHVEWGGDSHAGRHSESPDKALQNIKPTGTADERAGDASLFGGAARVSKDGDWSESYICNLIDWHLKEQETMPWLTGTAQWPFKDFSTPVRPDNPVPYMNQKGVVERDLTKKEAYYVFQSYWTTEPMVHIYGHSFPVRWGDEGEEKMIKVYSNCEEVELFVDGNSYGKKRRNSQDFPAAGLRWNVPLKKGFHRVAAVATYGRLPIVSDNLTFHYQTEKWGKPAKLVFEKIADKAGVATLQVNLLDNKNVQCLDAKNWVRFALAGDGELIDDLGTSDGSRYVQMYNGRAVIRVRTNNGKSVVSATSDSVASAFITLSEARFYGQAVAEIRDEVMKKAVFAMMDEPITVTKETSPRSAGGKHDFFSEGDYWWPDPRSVDSPYVQRDGMTNPDNFVAHRVAMIRLSKIMGALASGYKITGDERFVQHALRHANAWFVDTATRMNPNLLFAQAIKGRATGRGIGIIDTIHLIEVVQALMVMEHAIDKASMDAIRNWFAEYLQWLTSHKYGKDEMNAANNHGTCWVMQVAAFAKFTGDVALMKFCSDRYKNVLLPSQMATDGSFPKELARTKPYGYSIFNLDAMVMICQILSTESDDLWNYETPDGKSIRKGIEFLYPFIADKSKWTFNKDVMYWDDWPVAQPFLIFGANAFNNKQWFDTWKKLQHFPTVPEVERNLPIRNPLIWQ